MLRLLQVSSDLFRTIKGEIQPIQKSHTEKTEAKGESSPEIKTEKEEIP